MTWDWHDDDPATALSAQNMQNHIELRLRALEVAGSGVTPFKLDDLFASFTTGWRPATPTAVEGFGNYESCYQSGSELVVAGSLIHVGNYVAESPIVGIVKPAYRPHVDSSQSFTSYNLNSANRAVTVQVNPAGEFTVLTDDGLGSTADGDGIVYANLPPASTPFRYLLEANVA